MKISTQKQQEFTAFIAAKWDANWSESSYEEHAFTTVVEGKRYQYTGSHAEIQKYKRTYLFESNHEDPPAEEDIGYQKTLPGTFDIEDEYDNLSYYKTCVPGAPAAYLQIECSHVYRKDRAKCLPYLLHTCSDDVFETLTTSNMYFSPRHSRARRWKR